MKHLSTMPLITPDGVQLAYSHVSQHRPEWMKMLERLSPERVLFVVGTTHHKVIHMPCLEFAALLETCRFGITMETDPNGPEPDAKSYAKLYIPGGRKDNVPLRRFLSGAEDRQATKALEIESDYSVTNSYFVPAGNARKATRDAVMWHVKRLRQQNAPAGFDGDAYLANLASLYAALDAKIKGDAQ